MTSIDYISLHYIDISYNYKLNNGKYFKYGWQK